MSCAAVGQNDLDRQDRDIGVGVGSAVLGASRECGGASWEVALCVTRKMDGQGNSASLKSASVCWGGKSLLAQSA